MRIKIQNILHKLLIIATIACAAGVMTPEARAFELSAYTEKSRLAEGRWVKISVSSTGLYLITTSQLKQWGFTEPSKVRIYGYGGQRISDYLSTKTYIDDLPAVQFELTPKGIVFYGIGVESWRAVGNYYNHSLNPFSTKGYYFLTDTGDEEARAIPQMGVGGAENPATTFTERLFHENDMYKIGQTGHLIVGEDFKWNNSQTFTFNLTDIDLSDIETRDNAYLKCNFVTKTSENSNVQFTANDLTFPPKGVTISKTNFSSSHNLGMAQEYSTPFKVKQDKLQLNVRYTPAGTVIEARLDYITINYTRKMRMHGGTLLFRQSKTQCRLDGAGADTRVWDVTNPLDIKRLAATTANGAATWTNDYTGYREYAAWNPDATTFLQPEYVGTVSNQNLHDPTETPDMVIFVRNEWRAQAERLAEIHRNSADSLSVLIVDQEPVFNEFGSGVPDVNTFRRYLKMLYDRGNSCGKPLRYALFMGKPTYDNRRISAQGKALTYPTMPTWQSETSLSDNDSFTTDDFFSFLEDNSCYDLSQMAKDNLCIAVGRMPVRTADDAKVAVDKIVDYLNKSKRSTWRNQMMLVSDDLNEGQHMLHHEEFERNLVNTFGNDQFFVTKVYIDAFKLQNNTVPEARERMFNRLDEGTLWWSYIGHANPTSWTAEGLFTYNDINNLFIKNYPVLFAATCEFLNWDASAMSGAEILYFTRQGGCINAITAVRPVFINDNRLFTAALGRNIARRDEDGRFLTIGEIYRRSKNDIKLATGNGANSNKLRYVLMGDPALRYAAPANRVVVDRINGIDVTDLNQQAVVMARQEVILEGHITDPKGNMINDFTGALQADLFDAEYSTTSYGRSTPPSGLDGIELTFEEMGDKLYSGRDSISAGRFKMRIAMPEAVANNFRPAALNLYAIAEGSDASHDAMGLFRDFYVYGTDESAAADNEAPEIEQIYLNHPTFTSGDKVNAEPMLFASISDNSSINLSNVGIGHQMTLQIDGNTSYNDVSKAYTPDMGSLSGTIAYQVPQLAPGRHTLRLRVWDSSGNCGERTIECVVDPKSKPSLYEIYADQNPASVETNFYLVHDRPDRMMSVKVEVFNLLGQPVWSGQAAGISELFNSVPVNWNLTDHAGRRVKRGIYLYRATITESDGQQYITKSSRIAVTE